MGEATRDGFQCRHRGGREEYQVPCLCDFRQCNTRRGVRGTYGEISEHDLAKRILKVERVVTDTGAACFVKLSSEPFQGRADDEGREIDKDTFGEEESGDARIEMPGCDKGGEE